MPAHAWLIGVCAPLARVSVRQLIRRGKRFPEFDRAGEPHATEKKSVSVRRIHHNDPARGTVLRGRRRAPGHLAKGRLRRSAVQRGDPGSIARSLIRRVRVFRRETASAPVPPAFAASRRSPTTRPCQASCRLMAAVVSIRGLAATFRCRGTSFVVLALVLFPRPATSARCSSTVCPAAAHRSSSLHIRRELISSAAATQQQAYVSH